MYARPGGLHQEEVKNIQQWNLQVLRKTGRFAVTRRLWNLSLLEPIPAERPEEIYRAEEMESHQSGS